MVCVDTSFLIDVLNGNTNAESKLKSLAETDPVLSTTMVNAAELYVGVYNSENKDEELDKVTRILEILSILPFDERSAKKFGELSSNSQIKSNFPGDLDLLIASIAVTHKQKSILTNNGKHFERVPGLTVETW